jgi:dihydrofolate synthase/folylpolyglutamate synthase
VVLDVGHNPQAMRVLAENLSGMGFFEKTHAVLGMLADKDAAGSVAALKGRVDHWFLADLEGPRGLSAVTLAKEVARVDPKTPCICCPDPAAAFTMAREHAAESDRILVSGSFYTVAGALRALGRGKPLA